MTVGARRIPGDPPTGQVEPAGPPTRDLGPVAGQWVGIAANPGSGRGAGPRAAEGLAASLAGHGLAARIAWTPAERGRLVDQAGADSACRCLVAAGGDGTVAALLNDMPRVPIAVLPGGTENLFARHFRLDRRPERLARAIVQGTAAPLDLGLAAGRRFSLMAGFGFDADVVTRHHTTRVAASGRAGPTSRAAYVEPVLRSSFNYGFPPLTVRVEDEENAETLVGTTVFLFNLPRYALGLPFVPDARGDDGRLDLIVFRRAGPFRALHYLWLVLRGIHLRRDDVQHRRVRAVTVRSEVPVAFQLDGDPGGTLGADGVRVGVLPSAIEVIVP